MELIPLKLKHIPMIISWVKTEADMVQWAGPAFTWPLSQRQFRKHLEAAKQEMPSLYPFTLDNAGKVIGYCEISDYRRQANSAMLSRVIIAPRYRGKGYGKELVKKAVEYAFRTFKLNRLALGVFDFNNAAISCYANSGFVYEGTLRQSARVGDSYWNCNIMSILTEDYKC
jgi:RimJ/RimL family protein N-acetyltransferase